MKWLESIPLWLIALVAVAMAFAPFGASHLVEKWRMLFAGTLRRPLDWFDLVLHTAPLVLLLARVIVFVQNRR